MTTLATILSLANVLVDSTGTHVASEDVLTTVLTLWAVIIILFFCLDIFAMDKYIRYLASPYLMYLWIVCAVLSKNTDIGTRNALFTLFLVAVSFAFLIVKCVLIFRRHRLRPLYSAYTNMGL